MPGPLIVVDSREGQRIVEALADLGARVSVRPLRAADYVVASGVLVERKTVRDLHLSIVEGRLWRQMGGLRAASRRRYLLIEGSSLDEGPLSPNAIRGACLSVTGQAVTLLWSRDVADSARWLVLLATRWRQRAGRADRPPIDQAPPRAADPAEAVLAGVPGISVRTARALLAEFGSVSGVVDAGPDGWSRIRGIGPRRAAALHAALTLSRASHRR